MINKKIIKVLLLIGDIILMYGALFLTLSLRYGDFHFPPGPNYLFPHFILNFTLIFLIWTLVLFILTLYDSPVIRNINLFFRNLIIFIMIALAFGTIYFYLQPKLKITPKTILVLDIFIFSLLFCLWRYIFSRILKLKNLTEKIAIIGFRPGLKELINNNFISHAGYEISAFLNPGLSFSEELLPLSKSAKYGVISDINELKNIIKKEGITSVIFPQFLHKNENLIQQIFATLSLRLNYISFADFYENLAKKVPIEAVNESWFLKNISRPEKRLERILKRGLDVLFSFIGLIITILLFPFIAFTIKLDSQGSIFYIQKRAGRDKKVFSLYKFRTMKNSQNQDKELWRENDFSQITRVGRFLRKSLLDELPQFYNILKGDMSFVGPRPEWIELVKIFEKEIPFYSLRCIVKPGITGWAQLNFPASTSIKEAKEKFKYDLYYIKNRSFFLDIGIILKTIRLIFK